MNTKIMARATVDEVEPGEFALRIENGPSVYDLELGLFYCSPKVYKRHLLEFSLRNDINTRVYTLEDVRVIQVRHLETYGRSWDIWVKGRFSFNKSFVIARGRYSSSTRSGFLRFTAKDTKEVLGIEV